MRIEKEEQKCTVRLYIERHTVVMTRDSEEEIEAELRDVVREIQDFLKDKTEPRKFWWRIMRG